jgi:uncharacterized protein YcbX
MTQTVLGSIVSLWRYPVKSMLGEELNATEVTKRGLLGDRAYTLVDSADGKVASAKNPRKWPGLFDCRAAFVDVLAGYRGPRSSGHGHRFRSAGGYFLQLCAGASADHGHARSAAGTTRRGVSKSGTFAQTLLWRLQARRISWRMLRSDKHSRSGMPFD